MPIRDFYLVFGLMTFLLACSLFACKSDKQLKQVDVAISNAIIICVDSLGTIISNGTLLINEGLIVKLGPDSILKDTYQAHENIDAQGNFVLPGLINTHTHLPMSLLRGIADDLPLSDWLEKYIWPTEAAFMDREAIKIGSQLAMAELIRTGTTCFNDAYFFADEIAGVAEKAGLRGRVGEGLLDYPTPSYPKAAAAMEATRTLANTYRDHPCIGVSVAPHSPYACSAELLVEASALAQELEIPLHIHISETQTEQGIIAARYAQSPTAYLDSLGFWRAGFVGAHGVWLDSLDQLVLAQKGVSIAHCPESNMKLASGVAPVPEMQERGLNVGLGTDGASSNNDLDMFEEMSTAAKLAKVHRLDPTVLAAETVLRMATIEGAKLMGWENKIGSIELNKAADLIIVSNKALHMQPLYDVYSQIVYCADGSDVTHSMVAGKWLMKDQQLLTLDQRQILKDVSTLRMRILAALPE
ncbi:MAG: amidohydrolase [Bacteroidota bacterium]